MYTNNSTRGPSAPLQQQQQPKQDQQSPPQQLQSQPQQQSQQQHQQQQQQPYGDYSYQNLPYNSYQATQGVRNVPNPSADENLANIRSKFSPQDITVLKQLLGAGEKHKWKQITKEINQSSTNNRDSYDALYDGQKSQVLGKNVSPTFVIKQYQTLIGLPNNALYFGTLVSSLPYVVGPSGWDDLNDSAYQHQFGDDVE